jgi:hypothetical protein
VCGSCTSANGIEITANGGRAHVEYSRGTLRYADVFPGRVDPMDDATYCASIIALRATESRFVTFARGAAQEAA